MVFDLRAAIEDALIAGRVKGSRASGNWGHGGGRGGPGNPGGSTPGSGLSAIGIGYGSTPEERREMAAQYRAARAQAPAYETFSTVAEAKGWLADNEEWTSYVGMRHEMTGYPLDNPFEYLSDDQVMQTAATLRQMKELSPDAKHYTERGVDFNPGGTNSYYFPHQERYNTHTGQMETAQQSSIGVGLAESKGVHSDVMIRVHIEELEMSIERMGADRYSTARLARWRDLQEFKETGRWEETYPHAKYMYGDQVVRSTLVHETGHWVHDEINRHSMFSRAQTRILAQRYLDSPAERHKIGVTHRGMDSFEEAMAENWSVYVAGKRNMMDPDMAKVFDVWTGQREREEAWPQYAGPNPKAE